MKNSEPGASKYKLLQVAKEQDFTDLGFKVFQNSEEDDPRSVYFELKVGRVTFCIDAWFEVTAVVEEVGFIEALKVDSLPQLESCIRYVKSLPPDEKIETKGFFTYSKSLNL